MNCPKCGNEMNEGDVFCGKCGFNVEEKAEKEKGEIKEHLSTIAGAVTGAVTGAVKKIFTPKKKTDDESDRNDE